MGKRDYILSILLTIYTALLRFGQNILPGSIRDSESSVLVLPSASVRGNLGDEALVAATVTYLKEKDVKRIGLISYIHNQWEEFESVCETLDMQDYFSSNSLQNTLKTLLQFIQQVSQYERFYFLGADVVDGYYSDTQTYKRLQLVSLAAQMGLESAILGFSFNKKPNPNTVKVLQKLPPSVKLLARDPITKDRLIYHLNRPAELAADVAFLLHPADNSNTVKEIAAWVSQEHANNRIVIGVSPYGRSVAELEINTLERITQIYVDTLLELSSKNEELSFLLLPHDCRSNSRTGKFSDLVLNQKIFETLPSQLKHHCQQLPKLCSAAEIKEIVGQVDIVLSGKFHLAIACLGQCTPVGCITYQDKFEGLFKQFGLEGLMIEPEQAYLSGNLANFILPLIEKRKSIRQQIKQHIPEVLQLAHTNFLTS